MEKAQGKRAQNKRGRGDKEVSGLVDELGGGEQRDGF